MKKGLSIVEHPFMNTSTILFSIWHKQGIRQILSSFAAVNIILQLSVACETKSLPSIPLFSKDFLTSSAINNDFYDTHN